MNKIDEYLNCYKDLEFYRQIYETSSLKQQFNLAQDCESKLISEIADRKDKNLYLAIYYYLVWNGYFSADKTFIATSNDSIELKTDLGIGISCGNGCCRNFAPHFKTILSLLDENQDLILVGTKYHYPNNPLPKTRKIKTKVKKSSMKIKREFRDWKFPNHIELLDVSNPENIMLFDPFNLNIQELINKRERISRRKMIDFGIPLFLDFDISDDFRRELLEIARPLERQVSKKILSEMPLEKRMQLRAEAIELCEQKKSLVEAYHRDMNPTYQYIKREARNFQSKGF